MPVSGENVQPELSKLIRVCSYDRAGLGWSDPRAGLRDSGSIADQLHHLLAAAGIPGPLVLMDHSIAGLHMRAYLSKYPQGITGVVFVHTGPLGDLPILIFRVTMQAPRRRGLDAIPRRI